jgi:hypothetical protein
MLVAVDDVQTGKAFRQMRVERVESKLHEQRIVLDSTADQSGGGGSGARGATPGVC